MKRLITFAIVLFLTAAPDVFSQVPAQAPPRGGEVKGELHDGESNAPLEYANVVLYRATDSTMVTGTVTDASGTFILDKLSPGRYYLDAHFLGFESKRIENILIGRDGQLTDVGLIKLYPSAIEMQSVEVEAERSPISYHIDKKVINVDQQIGNLSGTAVDVLENVPSITVDIEGNVSLRGSQSFQVLIDGRPSILEGSEALQQIPTSAIENIEIITNPSAKYDPEGTAGIINIIMKKSTSIGQAGLVNVNAGLRDKYGADLLYELKSDQFAWTLGADFNDMDYPGSSTANTRTTLNDVTTYINTDGNMTRSRNSGGVRTQLDWIPTESNKFTFNASYNDRSFEMKSNQSYTEFNSQVFGQTLTSSLTDRGRGGSSGTLGSAYLHKFEQKGHELMADLSYQFSNGDEFTNNQQRDGLGALVFGQKTTESGPGREYRIKLDYTLPIGLTNKVETGYQSEFDWSKDKVTLSEFNAQSGLFEDKPEYGRSTTYIRNVHAAYGIFSGEMGSFGYQGGLRAEMTDRNIEYEANTQTFSINRWDVFPTVHTSYKFESGQQVMASYTRRIQRPRGWELEPFETRVDAYNIRQGNPDLKPEYIDSWETGFQWFLGKTLLSTEFYLRQTYNKIERVQSAFAEDVTLMTAENVGEDKSYGTELMLNTDVIKGWSLNLMGNLYQYEMEGTLFGERFTRSSFNWNTRVSNIIRLIDRWQFQVDGMYNSPSTSSQGTREGFITTNMAVKYDIIPRQLSATLQIRDLLGTAKYEFTNEGNNFYRYNLYDRESPIIMLNIRYNINNYQQDRRQRGGEGGSDMGGGDDF